MKFYVISFLVLLAVLAAAAVITGEETKHAPAPTSSGAEDPSLKTLKID